MIHMSNCSECSMRLTGTIQDIKNEVLKMIDIVIQEDYSKQDYPKGISKTKKKKFDDMKKKIKGIKNLYEFELLDNDDFDLTSRATHFKETNQHNLLVGTSDEYDFENNLDNAHYLGQDGYYDIKGKNKYFITFEDDKYIIAQQFGKNDRVKKTICIDKTKKLNLDKDWDCYDEEREEDLPCFKMFKINGEYHIKDKTTKRLIKVKEVTDKNIVKQLETLISLGMKNKN